jgi:hypothetical protein
VKGLQLPKALVEKLYHENTEPFFGHVWKD